MCVVDSKCVRESVLCLVERRREGYCPFLRVSPSGGSLEGLQRIFVSFI